MFESESNILFDMRNYAKLHISVLVLFALSGIFSLSHSQNKNEDFADFYIDINLAKNIKNSELDDYWNEKKAAGISILTPYYSGMLHVGVTYRPFESFIENDSIPDCSSLLYYIGWEKSLKLTPLLTFSVGPNIGLFQMIFDETDEVSNSTDLYEHEVTLGFTARLDYKLTDRFSINTFLDYNKVMTKKRINMVYAGAGLSYSFRTPGWLVDFLK